jgi:hypothetical protein
MRVEVTWWLGLGGIVGACGRGGLVENNGAELLLLQNHSTKDPRFSGSVFAGYGTVNRSPMLFGLKELIP